MTAPVAPNGGYVSNEVIALQIKHVGDTVDALRLQVVGELQMLRSEMVRRDLYDEQRRADLRQLEQVQAELKEARQRKWAVWLAVAVAFIALGRDMLGELVKAGLS